MARLNFPASPTDGQLYASDSGGTYVWNSDKTKWSRAVGPAYVTLTGIQTLTNKTLTAPIIATISNTGTITLPTSTDTLVGRATTDTLTNKTLTAPAISSPTMTGTILEDVYTLSGTTPALDPDNGSIQTWTLSGNSTPTDSLSAGESITLMIDDGTAYTITWPTMTWINNAGSAPTLATSGYTVVVLWKVSTTLYGALVGDGT